MKSAANGGETDGPPVRRRVLLVTMLDGIDTRATEVAGHLGVTIEIAGGRSEALRMLDRKSYSVVAVDQMLAETDAPGTELLWKRSGLAIPLQLSFSLAGTTRLERELRMAMARRDREQELARMAASAELDTQVRNAVTAFLLECQLALQEDGIPPRTQSRLRTMAGIADRMRASLQKTTGALQGNSRK